MIRTGFKKLHLVTRSLVLRVSESRLSLDNP